MESRRFLRAPGANTKKLQGMAQIGKTIFFCELLFCVAYRAGDIDQHDVSAFFANEVIVVFMGIPEFVVAAGTLEIHFVNQMQFLHQQNHPEYGGIVRLGSRKSHRTLLDFLERHGFLRCKETLEDTSTVFGDSQTLFAQRLGDTVGGEMRNHKFSISHGRHSSLECLGWQDALLHPRR